MKTVVRKLLDNFEEAAGAVLLSVMCLVAIIQVAARYLLSSPPAWTEELATLLFAWLVFVGASLALKRNEHFALEVAVEILPRSVQRVLRVCVLLLILAFCGLLIVYGFRLSARSWEVTTAVLEIPRTWLYASVPFGGMLMLLRTIQAIVRWWKKSDSQQAEGNQ